MPCLGQSFSPKASLQAPPWQGRGKTPGLPQAPSLLLSQLAHGSSPWPLFSSPVEAPGPGAEVPEVWAQEGAPAQLPCSPTIPLQDPSLLRTGGVTWQHLPDRYAPQTWATELPNPAAMASRLITQGPKQTLVPSPELSVPLKPVACLPCHYAP